MADDIKKMLNVRKKRKAKKPDFRRQEGYRHVRLKDAWRRPRGRHSKLRKGRKARGKKPSAGYGSPRLVKGLDNQGMKVVYVSNRDELTGLNPKTDVAVIRSGVGKKKRFEIALEAEKLRVKVKNAYRVVLPGSK
jgi:large subunit ribosomal protein L32e